MKDKLKFMYQYPDNIFQYIFHFILVFISIMILIGSQVDAKFWQHDDYEILRYIGKDNVLNLSDIPEILKEKTDYGRYLESPRFRAGHLFKIIETYLYGPDASKWYLARIIYFSLFLFCLHLIFLKHFNII